MLLAIGYLIALALLHRSCPFPFPKCQKNVNPNFTNSQFLLASSTGKFAKKTFTYTGHCDIDVSIGDVDDGADTPVTLSLMALNALRNKKSTPRLTSRDGLSL
jgi:hypothetical protein